MTARKLLGASSPCLSSLSQELRFKGSDCQVERGLGGIRGSRVGTTPGTVKIGLFSGFGKGAVDQLLADLERPCSIARLHLHHSVQGQHDHCDQAYEKIPTFHLLKCPDSRLSAELRISGSAC